MSLCLDFKMKGDSSEVTVMEGEHCTCRELVGLGGSELAQVPRGPNPG